MKRAWLAVVVASCVASCVAACGANNGSDGAVGGDAGGGSGDPFECGASVSVTPDLPVAGPSTTLRLTARVEHALGVLAYHWQVGFNATEVVTTPARSDGSEIELVAATPGVYDVRLAVTGAGLPCPEVNLPINVRAPGARSQRVRLRVVAPASTAAPPFERGLTIDGGATTDIGTLSIDPGVVALVSVRDPAGAIASYLRFAPSSAPDAVVEGFADATGNATVRLLDQPYSVLIVPSGTSDAPRRFSIGSSPTVPVLLAIDAAAAVTGTVLGPDSAPVVGAGVQLSIAGVPSSLGTTAADGSFTVRAAPGSGEVTVDVTPPVATGLPRLLATSTAFDLAAPVQVRYAPGLVLRSLAGTRVLRQGAPVGNARVMVVGALAMAGTVTAGTPASATGELRVSAIADAAGALPAALIPAAKLSAVITVAAGDLAVAALDATASVPATLDAPAMLRRATAAQGPGAAALGGAVLDVVPSGALALAAVPAAHLIADASGGFDVALAAGGHYELRLRDPRGRAASIVVADRTAATIAASYRLATALRVRGRLTLGTTGQPLTGASIQILCDACTGLERAKPIAEAASDDVGGFTLAVPDPGTM